MRQYICVHNEYSTKPYATPEEALMEWERTIGSEDEEALEVWEVVRQVKKKVTYE